MALVKISFAVFKIFIDIWHETVKYRANAQKAFDSAREIRYDLLGIISFDSMVCEVIIS